MAMSGALHLVARLDQLREDMGHLVLVEGREIALFLKGREVLAVDARCPHAGGPLHEGMVCGDVVVCPLHLRRVDLHSGAVDDWPAPVRTYQAVIEGGKVLVRYP
jgi:nitrite reductase/ring-hydroxylating ferredoxin subunit